MNIVKHLILSGIVVGAGSSLWSCQDSDKAAEEAPLFTYELTANAETAYESSNSGTKKTLTLTESAGRLLSNFNTGEKLIGYNYSADATAQNKPASYSQLSAQSRGAASQFTGNITSSRAPKTSDEFGFFYPGTAAEGNGRSVFALERKQRRVGRGLPQVSYERSNRTQPYVELMLNVQDGTLPTISQKFDYQFAKATPKRIEGSNVIIQVGRLQRKIAIWGLRFTDSRNQPITNIDSIRISEVKSSKCMSMSSGNFISEYAKQERSGISVKAKTGTKLTSAGGKFTYIALFPGTYSNVAVTVYSGSKTYQRNYSQLQFNQDHFHKSDILKMEEYVLKPYIEINGVKWAKGNFIRYNQGGEDYWGIAPTQWWISNRHMNGTTSQFVNKNQTNPTEDDKDHFRFGAIENATAVRSNDAYKVSAEIRTKFYPDKTRTDEVSRGQAKYGDIVYYHTMNYKDQYRYPSESELAGLFNNASVKAGYCYSDAGLKIYGAYFYETPRGQQRVNEFPAGRGTGKYKDVSQLVRTNQGLFLPIAGWIKVLTRGHVSYKNINEECVGKYSSDKSKREAVAPVVAYEFGSDVYKQVDTPYAQAVAIRPVWVGTNSDSRATNPTHSHFKNLK